MSSIKLSPNASGTGEFTIAAPNSNTNRTLTLPDQTGTVLTDSGPISVNASAPTSAMTLDASGNLLVGTTSGIGKLAVTTASADGNTSSWSNGYLTIAPGGTSTSTGLAFSVDTTNNRSQITSLTPGVSWRDLLIRCSGIQFFTNNGTTETARIDNSGNLLVGATSAGTVGAFICPATYSYTTGSGANVFVDSSGRIMRSTSSLKYKTDVQDATHGLSDVLGLRSVTYKSKEESDGDKVFGGLIAEEVHAAGLSEFVQYADDGTPDAISYGPMVSLCIKAIQEQQAIITALTARIEALEAK